MGLLQIYILFYAICAIPLLWLSLFTTPFAEDLNPTFETCQANVRSVLGGVLVSANATMCVQVHQNITLGKDCTWVDPTKSFTQFHMRHPKPYASLLKKLRMSKDYPSVNGYYLSHIEDMYWFSGPKQISDKVICNQGNKCKVRVYWSLQKNWLINASVTDQPSKLPGTVITKRSLSNPKFHQKAEFTLHGPVAGRVVFNHIFNGIKAEYRKQHFFHRPTMISKESIYYLEPIYIDKNIPDGIFGFEKE